MANIVNKASHDTDLKHEKKMVAVYKGGNTSGHKLSISWVIYVMESIIH